MVTKGTTVPGVFVHRMLAGARRRHLEYQPLLGRYGLSEEDLKSDIRLTLDSFAQIGLDLMIALDDEFIGGGERRQPLGSFAMMCRSCISARTVKQSIVRAANYWNLFENTYNSQVTISGGRVNYELKARSPDWPINHYAAESMMSSVHRFHCWLAGQFIPLSKVSVAFSEPTHSHEFKRAFYGAPVGYEATVSGFEFDSRYLSLAVIQTPETLDGYIANKNMSLLYQPRQYRTISERVRQWLEKHVRRGNQWTTLDRAGNHFQMSRQALYRRLRSEGTSFQELKMHTQRDLAIGLLYAGNFRIEDIAHKVGFSEPSAFVRAFKGWTGMTPLAYAKRHR